jgi:hypothetical protein
MKITKPEEYAAVAAAVVVVLVIGIVFISYRASKLAVTWVGPSGGASSPNGGALTRAKMYGLTDSAGNIYVTKPIGSKISQMTKTGTVMATGTISKTTGGGLSIDWTPAGGTYTSANAANGTWTYTPSSSA